MNNDDVFERVRDRNYYKVKCGFRYIVYRQEIGGYVFYRIPVEKKNVDGSKTKTYKQVAFRNKEKNCDIPNETYIIPLTIIEDFYFPKRSDGTPDKYHPVFTLVITDWEEAKTAEQREEETKAEAIDKYKKSIDMQDINLDDELPF